MGRKASENNIDWGSMGQETFDRAVSALLHRIHEGAEDPHSPSDRGGDGGIDFIAEYSDEAAARGEGYPFRDGHGACKVIYQYKYFPDGLTANRTRKKQVLDSLKTAAQHEPDYWVLVIPGDIKDGVRAEIARRGTTLGVQVKFWDRSRLDSEFIKETDLLNYYAERDDYLLRRVEAYNLEKAVLTTSQDLVERAAALGRSGEDFDPHWRLATYTSGASVVGWLEAKHPNAAKVSPITLKPVVDMGRLDATTREAFDHVIGWGESGHVTIPGNALSKFEVQGPAWLQRTDLPDEVTIIQESIERSLPCTLTCEDATGARTGSFDATLTDPAAGPLGLRFTVDLGSGLSIRISHPSGGVPTATVSTNFGGSRPSGVAEACATFGQVLAADRVNLSVSGEPFAVFGMDPNQPRDDSIALLGEAAHDLNVLQEAANTRFPFPEELTLFDIAVMRAYRLAVEGACARLPLFSTRCVITRDLTEGDMALLTGGCQMMVVQQEGTTVTLDGHDLYLAYPTTYLLPEAHVPDLTSRGGAFGGGEREVIVKSQGQEPFRIFMPGRYQADQQDRVVLTNWNLPGVDELGS